MTKTMIPEQLEVATNEQQLATLQAYKEQIAAAAVVASTLTIAGIDDRKGYKVVHDTRMSVKNLRVAITKRAKEIRDDAVKFQKAVIAVEKELIDMLSPIENHLLNQEEAIDAEKERIKAEEARKKAEALQVRMDQLMAVGCFMNPQQVADMSAERFSETIKAESEKYEARKSAELIERQQQEAEELRLKQEREAEAAALAAERERLRLDREAENARIAAENARMAEERRGLEAQQRKEREALDAARAEMEREKAIIQKQKDDAAKAEREAKESACLAAMTVVETKADEQEQSVRILMSEWKRMRDRDQLLSYLELEGVSSWEGYAKAVERMNELPF